MTSATLHTAPPLANGSAARPRTLGVLMLETRFPRPVGDIGHPQTFAFPVRHAVVRGASPRRVVHGTDPRLLQPFIEAGRRLVDEGADAISTSCGFLVLFQQALAGRARGAGLDLEPAVAAVAAGGAAERAASPAS